MVREPTASSKIPPYLQRLPAYPCATFLFDRSVDIYPPRLLLTPFLCISSNTYYMLPVYLLSISYQLSAISYHTCYP